MPEARRFFESRLRRYGDSPKTLGWSAKGQRRRFEVLADVGNLRGREVLDVGCGLGHFYDFLREGVPDVRYAGLDSSARMIAAARKRIPGVPFEVHNAIAGPLPRAADFVVASGVLNLEQGDNDAAMRRFLRVCFAACREAAAVNMLSTWADLYDSGRHYYEPLRTARAARRLTRRVVLRHDYLPHDFTLYLYREPFP